MEIRREWLEELIYGIEGSRRFTQDSPILPDVWIYSGIAYSIDPLEPQDLLLTPHRYSSAPALAVALRERLKSERGTAAWKRRHRGDPKPAMIVCNQSTVAARLCFDELIRAALPLSRWWRDYLGPYEDSPGVLGLLSRRERKVMVEALEGGGKLRPDILWMVRLVGAILLLARVGKPPASGRGAGGRVRGGRRAGGGGVDPERTFRRIVSDPEAIVEACAGLIEGIPAIERLKVAPLWTVSRNRRATASVWKSTLAIKADAAQKLFSLSCEKLTWAVVDSGIDATHPAFVNRRLPNEERTQAGEEGPLGMTRVQATYDFSRLRPLLMPDGEERKAKLAELRRRIRDAAGRPEEGHLRAELKAWNKAEAALKGGADHAAMAQTLREGLLGGRTIDWDLLEPLLRVPHSKGEYAAPGHEHGTHVAGILAGDLLPEEAGDAGEDQRLTGVCPDLRLYDLRVLNDAGEGDEFSVIAALQFIRHLNENRDQPAIHGVNLSLAIRHDVANYACGRTPVCDECERLIGSGVIVVAAAGNEGYVQYLTSRGVPSESYRSISITDPGNADGVITVGATHRNEPHTYGVSYFSSRGPTGDGRLKPDLVAPGEKIKAPVPLGLGGVRSMDGTSMAAPHVSGAAALLIARHRELLGQPAVVKKILCDTATDLGRERYFQGHGMVDVLRAIQSV